MQNRLPLLLIALAHAPLPQGMWAVTGSKVNPRLAHLFMICSNIKLRWPEESIGIEICIFVSNPNGIEGTFDALPALSLARRNDSFNGDWKTP
jgi:hypothetical protein